MKVQHILLSLICLGIMPSTAGAQGGADLTDRVQAQAYDARVHAQSELSRRHVAKAKLALANGETKTAIDLLQQAIVAYPDGEDARVRLAYIHADQKQPNGVIEDLKPMLYPPPNRGGGWGAEITTRMMYVLALLDCGCWEEAANLYNASVKPGAAWSLPGGGPSHTFPEVQFRPDTADYQDLRGLAHLILGAYPPVNLEMANNHRTCSGTSKSYCASSQGRQMAGSSMRSCWGRWRSSTRREPPSSGRR